MSRTLTILLLGTPEETIRRANESGDMFALTPLAMAQCEKLGVSYLVLDAFIGLDEMREMTFSFYGALFDLCLSLDSTLDPETSKFSPYRATCYPIYSSLSVAHIVATLLARILERYDAFQLVGVPKFKPLEESLSPQFEDSWVVDCLESSLQLVAKLMSCSPACAGISFEWRQREAAGLSVWRRTRPVLSRIKQALLKRLRRKFTGTKPKATILVSTMNYGVSSVATIMPEVAFLQIPEPRATTAAQRLEMTATARDRVEAFAASWFPGYSSHVAEFFHRYHSGVISHIMGLQDNLGRFLDAVAPSAMLVTNGFLTHKLNVCAKLCIERHITVFSYQHGGTLLHKVPNDFEIETRPDLDAVWLYQGMVDAQGNPWSRRSRIGNIVAWEIAQRVGARRHRALCVQAPNTFSFFGYVDLSDRVKHGLLASVLRACTKVGVGVDIKSHVIDAGHNEAYFSILMEANRAAPAKVIVNGVIEPLMHQYDLIIIFVVGSLPSTLSLGLDVPVIFFAPSIDDLRDDARRWYLDRVYHSKTEEELERLLSLYAQGRLAAKNVDSTREAFLWSTEGAAPAERLASRLRAEVERVV